MGRRARRPAVATCAAGADGADDAMPRPARPPGPRRRCRPSGSNSATGIIIVPQRNPLVLAKQVASLDRISGGRFHLGIGVGYLEPELNAIGVTLAERASRTDDALAAMRALWYEPAPVSLPRSAHVSSTGWTPIPARSAPCRSSWADAHVAPTAAPSSKAMAGTASSSPRADRRAVARRWPRRPTGTSAPPSSATWRSASRQADRSHNRSGRRLCGRWRPPPGDLPAAPGRRRPRSNSSSNPSLRS